MIRRKSTSLDPELAAHMAQLDSLGERMSTATAHCRSASAGAAEVEDRSRRLALTLGQSAPLITEQKERPQWQPVQPSPRPRRPISASATTTPMSLPST
jgi:hypothetical protein